ncbi:MAG: EAL domain-containing protein [Rhodospirillaceae bacterium]|nr:EAL domain-containing protein [Rhodospirillaceae bacterium]
MTTKDDTTPMNTPAKPATTTPTAPSRAPSPDLFRLDLRDIVLDYAQRETFIAKTDAAVRDVISSEMRPGEIFRAVSPGVYHLVFPRASAENAAQRNATIEEKVARLIRETKPSAYNAEAFNERAALMQKVAAARRTAESQTPVRPSTSQLSATQLNATRAIERMMETSGNRVSSQPEVRLTEADVKALAPLKLGFHPMWHVQHKLITGYRCVLALNGTRPTLREASRMLNETADDVIKAKIDMAACTQAVERVQTMLRYGRKALLIVPVNFSTIEQPRFLVPFMDTLGKAAPDAMKLLVFELLGLPPGVTRFRLQEPFSHLRSKCRAVVVRTGSDFTNLEAFRDMGAHAVGLDAGEYPWKEHKMIAYMEQFAAIAQRHRLQAFVHGVPTNSLTVAAVAAGFTYVDGPAIAGSLEAPEAIHEFAVESLYARKATAHTLTR